VKRKGSDLFIAEIRRKLETALGEAGIHAKIYGRIKSLSSIYRKLRRQKIDVEQVYDYVQMNIFERFDTDAGRELLKIVDPSSMQLEATANQAEARQLRVGLPATIELDAFRGVSFLGTVYSIGAMANVANIPSLTRRSPSTTR
jgi:hypothetical protein